MDPLQTETARFWENHGELQRRRSGEDPDRGDRAADDLLRRGRGLADQFRPLAAMALGGRRRRPARPSTTPGSWRSSILRLKALYQKEGGAVPEPILNLDWRYKDPERSDARRAGQGDQRLRARGHHRSERSDQGRCSPRASRSSASPRCATTARRPAAAGSIPAASPRRATTWPAATTPIRTTPALFAKWAWSWPVNRRILYNRASADMNGKPWDPSRKLIVVGRQQVDRLRRARHRADRQARTWSARSS